jgi:transketolase
MRGCFHLPSKNDLTTEEFSKELKRLEDIARQTRKWVVKMTHAAGSGHPGGSLSATDVITVLYFYAMNHRPEEPLWPDRDRFVLSKGHAAPALYATLAQAGYFEKERLLSYLKLKNPQMYEKMSSESVFGIDLLMKLRKLGFPLQGHPDLKSTPGIEASTGSEGQGLSMGIGMALGSRLDRRFNRIYIMIGDGEMDCGQTWEAAMAAAHFKLDNMTVFVDANGLQLDGPTREIMSIEPIGTKWKSFGWHVLEIDGHNMKEIINAIEESKNIEGKPTVIIARTFKGKGVSFMKGAVGFHGKAPNDEELEQALKELEAVDEQKCN